MKKIIFIITILFISCETQKSEMIDLFNAENDPNVSCYRIPSIITASGKHSFITLAKKIASVLNSKITKKVDY